MSYANALMGGATLLAAAAVAMAATPLHGRAAKPVIVTGEQREIITRQVSYADLDLASMTGKRALNRRVGFAVQDVCSEAVGRSDTWGFRYCSVDAWRDARPQISLAVERARQIASTGTSSITAAAAITFAVRD